MKTYTNKKAIFDFDIIKRYQAGIVLLGTEVKSIQSGKIDFIDSWVLIDNNEVFLKQFSISTLDNVKYYNHEPQRVRKLLLKKSEILDIKNRISGTRLTVIPVKLYQQSGFVKIEIAIASGKKLFDKRNKFEKISLGEDSA